MFLIILTCFFMLNAIFWGTYPVSEYSPHNKIFKILGIQEPPTLGFHIILGTIFYLLSITTAQYKLKFIFNDIVSQNN